MQKSYTLPLTTKKQESQIQDHLDTIGTQFLFISKCFGLTMQLHASSSTTRGPKPTSMSNSTEEIHLYSKMSQLLYISTSDIPSMQPNMSPQTSINYKISLAEMRVLYAWSDCDAASLNQPTQSFLCPCYNKQSHNTLHTDSMFTLDSQ